jgi:hypothetical protein
MFNKINFGKLTRMALLSAVAAALAACAGNIIGDAPAHQVAFSGIASYAQLITELRSEGYSDIRVTEFYPEKIDPRPELMHPLLSADDPDAQATPVHLGWNGTAEKDGRIVDIYVTRAP